ncbi:LSU ribosomal protein L6P [Geoalkalibacter ferrihydriticus]|uniref:Large ribosomal subunit protein uL6 n=2 Tax=Geoalkalibacter ferrihydriticus TaxID=392333 RepID=A0A0C2HQK6_9BACT|nr:50S ribosomal protein L6 [Geoalkalibacter ferrihydriticus]KIH77130.1 50S ribosomal protein L6 [Geoalkalibacter ferrihydriticus DSM 17813]SDL33217.1 LSU ribosomal protein L6P [Geoalkalibacter ferrihydriticus]
MSRIGKLPVQIPAGVKISLDGCLISVQGPKGRLSRNLPADVNIAVEGEVIQVQALSAEGKDRSMQGLTRTLIANMVDGVTKGFERILEINGVGYRADVKGNVLNLALGYSHPVEYNLPEGISAEVEKQTKITVRGVDKELVGATAAKIRSFRGPEPYRGKGIKYAEEHIVRKAGKTGKK